jgi:undecaprenyl phosphate-alpha-L-ara4FN deformylase
MKLALKIDVDTYRGTREGVPRLIEVLKKHNAGGTFLFSLGPDHTGRAITRAFRPGFMKKVSRTSVLEHYGIKTLLYGTLLPGPDIGRRCAEIMRGTHDAGFETGIHTWDHVKWQDHVAGRDEHWTGEEMGAAYLRYAEIFGANARTHGAAGWQMNLHALRLTQRLRFDYCSDTRGRCPFIPIWHGEIIACPQLPTTLPTLDELIGLEGLSAGNVAEHLLRLSENPPPTGHVYTLHAELEGMKLLPAFEALLLGWRAMGYELVAMRDIFSQLKPQLLPRHELIMDAVRGRSGTLAVQGKEFLA